MKRLALAEEEHHLLIDGRRWRKTDPGIPEGLRKELVSELMSARRAVKSATTKTEELTARIRVHDAKVALGERGAPYWQDPSRDAQLERARAAILALVRNRGAGKSICPSDAARVLAGEGFRPMMPLVRDAAASLVEDQQVVVTQKGQVVDIRTVRGPIRIALINEESLR